MLYISIVFINFACLPFFISAIYTFCTFGYIDKYYLLKLLDLLFNLYVWLELTIREKRLKRRENKIL